LDVCRFGNGKFRSLFWAQKEAANIAVEIQTWKWFVRLLIGFLCHNVPTVVRAELNEVVFTQHETSRNNSNIPVRMANTFLRNVAYYKCYGHISKLHNETLYNKP
jgi:hypothetical protein